MPPSELKISRPPAGARQRRHRWLALGWVFFALALAAWMVHLRLAPRVRVIFEARIDGQKISSPAEGLVCVDGRAVDSGGWAPWGWHELTVRAPDAPPYARRVFIGYGTNQLGVINLARNRGTLQLAVQPAAKTLRLDGPYYHATLTNSPGLTNALPVGPYRGVAEFAHLTQAFTFQVASNQTCALAVEPAMASLRLSSRPEGAQFLLLDLDRQKPVANGVTPFFAEGLPAGRYTARLTRPDYFQETNLTLARGEARQVEVPFAYGHLAFSSQPTNATVYLGEQVVGLTPVVLRELKPGSYSFYLEHEGYYPAEFSVNILGETNLSFATNLLNIQYTRSMTNALEAVAGENPDYWLALGNLSNALVAVPGDPQATALQTKYATLAKLQGVRAADLNEVAHAQARRRHPEKTFHRLTDARPYASLFDTQVLHFTNTLARVRDAVRAAVAAPPSWDLLLELKLDAQTWQGEARYESLRVGQQTIAIVAGQVSDTEVDVYFKIWDLALKIAPDGSLAREITAPNLEPVHTNYLKSIDPARLTQRRQATVEDFKTRLRQALAK